MIEIKKIDPMQTDRISAILNWLKQHESLIIATDAIQLTIHVKRRRDAKDMILTEDVQGTILHLVKGTN